MGALRQRRERNTTANTTAPILGGRRSSASTISKLVLLAIGTLVMIVAVPMLYNMPTPDLQTSSAAQKQKMMSL
eukprot:scaffold3200_cov106-Skeletonema_marinoi.AAC.15